jgi:cytochrome c-type biogenesis protein CcmH
VFWTIAAAVLLAAALIALFPLLRVKSLWQPLALALVFLIPAASLWIYNEIGTPDAIGVKPPPPRVAESAETHAPDSQEMDSMIAGLRGRLSQSPEDLDGWMLLARTLKATQRFEEAIEALETAKQISPDNPQIMVDLVETRIFLTPDGQISSEMRATLEWALDQQPGMPKALWLMGIASMQAGDDAFAISYWESLLEQLEPGSPPALSVQSQIDEAQARMGMVTEEAPAVAQAPIAEEAPVAEEAPPVEEDDGTWKGMRIAVNAGDSGQSAIPAGGVLYVMIRSPGPAMGPPLGVRRIINPELPLEITITDQDSMLKERQISSESQVQLQARISRTGAPNAASGDWQSVPVTVELGTTRAMELTIDQRVE